MLFRSLLTDEYTNLDWDSYQFRIINLTNKNSRLDVLPELSLIYDMIFKHNGGVKKMTSTRQAFDVAKDIVQIIYNVLPNGKVVEKEDPFGDLKGNLEPTSGENNTKGGQSTDVELTDAQKKSLERAIQKQKDFVDGKVTKTGKLSKKD